MRRFLGVLCVLASGGLFGGIGFSLGVRQTSPQPQRVQFVRIIKKEIRLFPICLGDITDSSPFEPTPVISWWNYLQGGLIEPVVVCEERLAPLGPEDSPPLIRSSRKR